MHLAARFLIVATATLYVFNNVVKITEDGMAENETPLRVMTNTSSCRTSETILNSVASSKVFETTWQTINT